MLYNFFTRKQDKQHFASRQLQHFCSEFETDPDFHVDSFYPRLQYHGLPQSWDLGAFTNELFIKVIQLNELILFVIETDSYESLTWDRKRLIVQRSLQQDRPVTEALCHICVSRVTSEGSTMPYVCWALHPTPLHLHCGMFFSCLAPAWAENVKMMCVIVIKVITMKSVLVTQN